MLGKIFIYRCDVRSKFSGEHMPSQFRSKFNILARISVATTVFTAVLIDLPANSPVAAQQAPAEAAQAQTRRPPASSFSRPEPIDFDDHDGWTQIFDGKTLNGWDGPSDIWHVEDGSIVGESSPEHPSGTTNIIWRGGELGNFRLKVEMKLEGAGANGGIQYRSLNVPPEPRQIPPDRLAQMTEEQKQRIKQADALAEAHAKWNLKGYQADFDFGNRFTGQLYEQGTRRGIIAWRGQMVATEAGKKAAAARQSGELRRPQSLHQARRVESIRSDRGRQHPHTHCERARHVHPCRHGYRVQSIEGPDCI